MKQQLYGHLPPITKTIEVRRTIHALHYRESKGGLINDVPLHAEMLMLADQEELICNSSVRHRIQFEDLPGAMYDRDG